MRVLKFNPLIFASSGILVLNIGCQSPQQDKELPNILWITTEDNSPFAGCYGDEFATTPNMDKLASEGFLYTHAYANAAVCGPARNTIITGTFACSGGHEHMRSYYRKSDLIRYYPQYLREKGYYCTNNWKEDYQIDPQQTKEIWDESSREAHYKNRKPGQPFFAVFNILNSHQAHVSHYSIPVENLRHDPQKVTLPPYHPDTPEMRHDWAQFYDKIEEMDNIMGRILQELEESGESENTIVFYYGDHGGVLPRSKGHLYESGTHVPFIVRIPEKFRHLWPADSPGSKVDRLVSFVDLAPTLLSLAGIPIPGYMQGHAFLGDQKTHDPEYVFMFRDRWGERYNMSRAVRDKKYRYIRNYTPYRIHGQHNFYNWIMSAMRSWEQAYLKGECDSVQSIFWHNQPPEELYDTENDPWEVNNLAENPAYKRILKRMRKANYKIMLRIEDAGFIPEAERFKRAGEMTTYDYMRSGNVPLKEIIKAAEKATMPSVIDIPELKAFLISDDSAIRYWGATGVLILGDQAKQCISELKAVLNDTSPEVVAVASEALYNLGEEIAGRSGLLTVLRMPNPTPYSKIHVMNVIDYVNDDTREMKDAVLNLIKELDDMNFISTDYSLSAIIYRLLNKWGIDPKDMDIQADFRILWG